MVVRLGVAPSLREALPGFQAAAELLVEAGRARGQGPAALGADVGQLGKNIRAKQQFEETRSDTQANVSADNARADKALQFSMDKEAISVSADNLQRARDDMKAATLTGDPAALQEATTRFQQWNSTYQQHVGRLSSYAQENPSKALPQFGGGTAVETMGSSPDQIAADRATLGLKPGETRPAPGTTGNLLPADQQDKAKGPCIPGVNCPGDKETTPTGGLPSQFQTSKVTPQSAATDLLAESGAAAAPKVYDTETLRSEIGDIEGEIENNLAEQRKAMARKNPSDALVSALHANEIRLRGTLRVKQGALKVADEKDKADATVEAAKAKAGEAQDEAWNALQTYATLRNQQGDPIPDDDYFKAVAAVQGGAKWENIAHDVFTEDKGAKKTARYAQAKSDVLLKAGVVDEEALKVMSPEDIELAFTQYQTDQKNTVLDTRQKERIAASSQRHKEAMDHRDILQARSEAFQEKMRGAKGDPALTAALGRQFEKTDKFLKFAGDLRTAGKSEEADNYIGFAQNTMHDAEATMKQLESGATSAAPAPQVDVKAKIEAALKAAGITDLNSPAALEIAKHIMGGGK